AEVAIGCAGLAPLDDWRGRRDAGGRELDATLIAVADEAAAAADLVRDKASRVPAAVVHGLERHVTAEDGPGAAALRRAGEEVLFRWAASPQAAASPPQPGRVRLSPPGGAVRRTRGFAGPRRLGSARREGPRERCLPPPTGRP